MAPDRRAMAVRIVPLRSSAAALAPAPADAADRLRLVLELSAAAWAVTHPTLRPRAEIRCVLRPLRAIPADRP